MSGFAGWLESMTARNSRLGLQIQMIRFMQKEISKDIKSSEFNTGCSFGSKTIDKKFEELLSDLSQTENELYYRISDGFEKNWKRNNKRRVK